MTASGNSRSTKRPLALLLGTLGLCTGGVQAADNPWLDTLRHEGFIAQGYLWSDHNNVFGDSSSGSFEFREIGLNASVRPLPRLQLAGQLLSRRAGETDDGDLRIDYALADYTAVSDARNIAGIRVGKLKAPFGLYNDTRDVPFTRPSILLPQSIYLDRSRDVALSAKGLQLYADRFTDLGLFSLQLSVGRPSSKGLDYAVFGTSTVGDFESKTSYTSRLLFDNQQGLTLGLTYAVVYEDYDPGPADPLADGKVTFRPLILSAQYDAGDWELTSELAIRPLKLRDFGVVPDSHTTGQSGYVQGLYRFNERWEALLRYDVLYTDRNDRDGDDYAAATGNPSHRRFARDLTFGVTWRPDSQWMLSAEFHHVDGTAWLAAQDNPQPNETERRWNLFLAELSFRF